MSKKIIKLTESDLTKLIERVISEREALHEETHNMMESACSKMYEAAISEGSSCMEAYEGMCSEMNNLMEGYKQKCEEYAMKEGYMKD